MSRHGFARDHEFTLPEQTDDSIASELQETQATLDCCPFPFSLEVCRRIMKNGFSAAFRVENTGCQPMPFCIGARTAFRCPPRTGGRFEDYAVVFDYPQTASMRLLSRDVRMEFSGFPMSAFWTNGDTEALFVCPEPWRGCAAWINKTCNFTDKPGCIVLFSGESKTFSYTVCVK